MLYAQILNQCIVITGDPLNYSVNNNYTYQKEIKHHSPESAEGYQLTVITGHPLNYNANQKGQHAIII